VSGAITTINFAITTACNRRCPDCCAGVGRVQTWSATREYLDRWAPLFRGVEVINVYGGEPTCHPFFDRITERLMVEFPDSRVILSTNGDRWSEHVAVIDRYEHIVVSHYGEWTYEGCPDNTVEVQGLARCFGSRVKVEKMVHRKPDLSKSGPCSALHTGALEFRAGVLYPCCTGSGTLNPTGIVPGEDWREKILESVPDCAGCPFATGIKKMNPVIVNVGLGKWYPRGSLRLRDTVKRFNPDVPLLQWIDEYPPGSPTHEQSPYAFKMSAINHAASLGHDVVLWCDSAMFCIKPLTPFFEEIKEHGHVLQENGFACGQWCSDKALEHLGFTRGEAWVIPDYTGCCMGLDMTNPRTVEFMRLLTKEAEDGVSFIGAWNNKKRQVSSDRKVLGHRHDQVVGSLLAHRLGMGLTQTHDGFVSYYLGDMSVIHEKAAMLNQGM